MLFGCELIVEEGVFEGVFINVFDAFRIKSSSPKLVFFILLIEQYKLRHWTSSNLSSLSREGAFSKGRGSFTI